MLKRLNGLPGYGFGLVNFQRFFPKRIERVQAAAFRQRALRITHVFFKRLILEGTRRANWSN